MIIVIQRTSEYVIQLTKTPGTDPKLTESIVELWNYIGPESMRELEDKTRYVKIEI